MILQRNDKEILKASGQFWDKVWWKRHQNWLDEIEAGKSLRIKEQIPSLEKAKEAARKIEKKYGEEES